MNRARHSPPPHQQRGVVIMLMLLILILGAATFLLSKLNKGDPQQPRLAAATGDLGEIRGALIGYAIQNNGCLPCPSLSAINGVAPAGCATPASRVGFLPWLSLNLGAQDRWAHRYRYKVDPNFATGSGCTFASATADLSVRTLDGFGNLTVTNNLPAVILSLGPNGYGASDTDGNAQANPPAANGDEWTNLTDTTLTFIQRPPTTDPAATGGAFDDVVAWVTRQTLRDQVDASKGGGVLPP